MITEATQKFNRTDVTKTQIRKITIMHFADSDADTSYIGTFSNTPETEFAIDHHAQFSSVGPTVLKYFNSGSVEKHFSDATWIPDRIKNKEQYWKRQMRKQAEQDYERIMKYEAGDFCFIGIRADAEILVGGVIQHVTSGGLWGIESDSDDSYITSTEEEQLEGAERDITETGIHESRNRRG